MCQVPHLAHRQACRPKPLALSVLLPDTHALLDTFRVTWEMGETPGDWNQALPLCLPEPCPHFCSAVAVPFSNISTEYSVNSLDFCNHSLVYSLARPALADVGLRIFIQDKKERQRGLKRWGGVAREGVESNLKNSYLSVKRFPEGETGRGACMFYFDDRLTKVLEGGQGHALFLLRD